MKKKTLIIVLSALCATNAAAEEFETATSAVANMRIGWNLGNTLESNSGDVDNMWIEAWSDRSTASYETAWGQPVTKAGLMKMMKEAGFNAVRVPVTWWPHMEATFKSVRWDNDRQGLTPWDKAADDIGTRIQQAWMKRVREVVDYVIGQGMYCILNVHHDTGDGNTAWLKASENDYEQQKDRFEAVWTQIAEEFRNYDEHLLFEGYNEMLDPYGSWCFASFATPSHYDAGVATSAYNAINSYAQSFVNAVRSTGGNNAQRNLIVSTYGACSGSGTWNSHLKDPLRQMKMPVDNVSNHIIFEVHSYIDVKDINNAKNEVRQTISDIKSTLLSKGAPVIFGEWGASTEGAYDNYRSNMLAFARYFVEQAKACSMGTFYWMGLSEGEHRSVPEFNQADLKDAIVKGYYGEEGYSDIATLRTAGSSLAAAGCYSIQGLRLPAPQRGLNIARLKDGKVVKYFKK